MLKKHYSIVITVSICVLYFIFMFVMTTNNFFTNDNIEKYTIAKAIGISKYAYSSIIPEEPIEEKKIINLQETYATLSSKITTEDTTSNADIINEEQNNNQQIAENIEQKQENETATSEKTAEVEQSKTELQETKTSKTEQSNSKTQKTEKAKTEQTKTVETKNTEQGEKNQTQVEQNKVESNPVSENNNAKQSSSTVASQYKGLSTIGKIEIPKTGVNMPVLSEVTVKGMEMAPCLLYSDAEMLNENGNYLIVGHNYNNIFTRNKDLQIGDKIYMTSLDGNRVQYTIYNKFLASPEETDYIVRDTNNMPEITLSTCTDDDNYRLIILAKM